LPAMVRRSDALSGRLVRTGWTSAEVKNIHTLTGLALCFGYKIKGEIQNEIKTASEEQRILLPNLNSRPENKNSVILLVHPPLLSSLVSFLVFPFSLLRLLLFVFYSTRTKKPDR
jgi:hypothetical protein